MVSTIIAGNKSSQKLGKSQSPCGQGQSELSEDDVKQFVAKEVIFIFLLPPFEFMHVLILNAKIKKQIHAWPFVSFFLPF